MFNDIPPSPVPAAPAAPGLGSPSEMRAMIAESFEVNFEVEVAQAVHRRRVEKEAAARADAASVAEAEVQPIDWQELFAQEDADEEWIIAPLLAARRQVALYSAPKVGKSLLLLEIAAAVAR